MVQPPAVALHGFRGTECNPGVGRCISDAQGPVSQPPTVASLHGPFWGRRCTAVGAGELLGRGRWPRAGGLRRRTVQRLPTGLQVHRTWSSRPANGCRGCAGWGSGTCSWAWRSARISTWSAVAQWLAGAGSVQSERRTASGVGGGASDRRPPGQHQIATRAGWLHLGRSGAGFATRRLHLCTARLAAELRPGLAARSRGLAGLARFRAGLTRAAAPRLLSMPRSGVG